MGDILYIAGIVLAVLMSLFAVVHALLRKRDPRSQLMWSLVALYLPILGSILYALLGVNRIQTRARKWKAKGLFDDEAGTAKPSQEKDHGAMKALPEAMAMLQKMSQRVTGAPLLEGNHIELLCNGEAAYPAMAQAISEARDYVYLASYIFENDESGHAIAEALIAAGERGVDVRVLVDAIGAGFGQTSIRKHLQKRKGIQLERFLPPTLTKRIARLNLRNHRKILIIDGTIGFTSGINISDRHLVDNPGNKEATADLHFRFDGPIVSSLESVFVEDWCFASGKSHWPNRGVPQQQGNSLCRGIKDGPNEDFEKLQWILIGALTSARKSVRILTPYFIPSRELLAALRTAVLRGAAVEIILPEKSNLRFVDWATEALLPEVLEYEISVFKQPSPFDHSKLLIIDDMYVNLGSANLDPRSLRLNFEFNVEVFDKDLAAQLISHHTKLKSRSRKVSIEELKKRSILIRLRNAFAKIFSPYL